MTKTTIKTSNIAKNNNTAASKRWSVIRATTGTTVRSFATRDEARAYKATGNFKMFDNINQRVVR